MIDFINTILKYTFLTNAVITALLASIACGITGSFVVKKKLSFVSGGIAHAVLGGIGIAYFFKLNISIGAIVFALLFCIILTTAKIYAHQSEDTLIGVLWAIGMSIGIIFMHLTPGYNVDLMSFIFGNILMVKGDDIIIVLIMNAGIIITTIIFFRHFVYLSFDEEFLKARGIFVYIIYLLLLFIISLTVVILIKVVGLILVIALLVLPAVIASIFTKTMVKMIIIAIILGIIFTFIGIFLSFNFNLPAGACIVIFSGLIYIISLLLKPLKIKF